MSNNPVTLPPAAPDDPPSQRRLLWSSDIERRFGVPGTRFTSVSAWFSSLVGLLLTFGVYAAINPFREYEYVRMFTDRGAVQYITVFFAFWTAAILVLKWRKVSFQRKAMNAVLVPRDPHFILSGGTASAVIDELYRVCDDPRQFVLFNRILNALSNLKNMGRIGDVEDVLTAQADHDADRMETSYSLCKGLIWAIPVLGFIGTVQGLSFAVGNFGTVLAAEADVSSLKPALRGVTSGLSVAFETTLVALVFALMLQLVLTLVKGSEEQMLDDFHEYCHRNLVNRVRLSPLEAER